MFHGKVEAVTEKGLTVNGEKVEGWMGIDCRSFSTTRRARCRGAW